MTAELSGMQEPFEPEFHFSEGQRVRIVEGPLTEFVGRVSESHREQQKVTVLLPILAKRPHLSSTSSRSRKSNRFYHRRKASTIQRGRLIRSHNIGYDIHLQMFSSQDIQKCGADI